MLVASFRQLQKTRSRNPSPSVQPAPVYPHTLWQLWLIIFEHELHCLKYVRIRVFSIYESMILPFYEVFLRENAGQRKLYSGIFYAASGFHATYLHIEI